MKSLYALQLLRGLKKFRRHSRNHPSRTLTYSVSGLAVFNLKSNSLCSGSKRPFTCKAFEILRCDIRDNSGSYCVIGTSKAAKDNFKEYVNSSAIIAGPIIAGHDCHKSSSPSHAVARLRMVDYCWWWRHRRRQGCVEGFGSAAREPETFFEVPEWLRHGAVCRLARQYTA